MKCLQGASVSRQHDTPHVPVPQMSCPVRPCPCCRCLACSLLGSAAFVAIASDPQQAFRPCTQLLCAMPLICRGFSAALPCCFSAAQPGMPARGNPAKGNKCVFCNEEWMEATCRTPYGRRSITRSLKVFRAHYEERSFVYNTAMMRVPDEWRDTFHEVALQGRRGPARRPRKHTPVETQATAATEEWGQHLANRKRAFKHLRSKEDTAYKKRRTADRSRAAKKFFLDNDLPALHPSDVAHNDCGLPAPTTSDRAKFAELWCKLGSWGICEKCRSLQPRPLEPIDSRRVAKATITAKTCKQCRGKHWVPQPSEIPQPLSSRPSAPWTSMWDPINRPATVTASTPPWCDSAGPSSGSRRRSVSCGSADSGRRRKRPMTTS